MYCIAHGILLKVMWQPEQEQSLGENGYMYICMAESFVVHPKLSQHCLLIHYTPIQIIIFQKKKKKKKNDSDDSTQNLKIQISFIKL